MSKAIDPGEGYRLVNTETEPFRADADFWNHFGSVWQKTMNRPDFGYSNVFYRVPIDSPDELISIREQLSAVERERDGLRDRLDEVEESAVETIGTLQSLLTVATQERNELRRKLSQRDQELEVVSKAANREHKEAGELRDKLAAAEFRIADGENKSMESLAEFFRVEAADWGQEGYDNGWTPAESAVHFLRKLRSESMSEERACEIVNRMSAATELEMTWHTIGSDVEWDGADTCLGRKFMLFRPQRQKPSTLTITGPASAVELVRQFAAENQCEVTE